MIDELACLLAYLPNGEVKARITESLSLLLSQGAGLGVLVVGASQDPRKEVLTLRDLFTTRIGLRLNEAGHVDLALGDGCRDRGALCDQIPADPRLRGIGYAVLEDSPEPARVRFGYLDDDAIKAMAAQYAAPPETVTDDEPAPVAVAPQRRPAERCHVYRPTTPAAPLLPEALLHALNPKATRDAGGNQ